MPSSMEPGKQPRNPNATSIHGFKKNTEVTMPHRGQAYQLATNNCERPPHNVVNAAAPKIAASLSGSAEATRSTRPM